MSKQATQDYLARLQETYSPFIDFGESQLFDDTERNYKLEIIELYKNNVADRLFNLPSAEIEQSSVGESLCDLFRNKLSSTGAPQNLVGWRYTNPLYQLSSPGEAKLAKITAALCVGDDEVAERVDAFVSGLQELLGEATAGMSWYAASRSLTSFLLMCSGPKMHPFIKTTEFNRCLAAYGEPKLDNAPLSGNEYVRMQRFCEMITQDLRAEGFHPRDLIDIQSFIYAADEQVIQSDLQVAEETGSYAVTEDSESTASSRPPHYWLYAPGPNARFWDEFYKTGILAIGWDEMGDLAQYPTKKEITQELQRQNDSDSKFYNNSSAMWDFVHKLAIGDVVYVKKGRRKVIGRGIVESEYIYDEARSYFRNTRKVRWTHADEWEHPGDAVTKTLTDITQYTDYVEKLKALFVTEDGEDPEDETPIRRYPSYSDEDFLNEVFMDDTAYRRLSGLLRHKKNIILQGAPGVGKTFIAKRIAWSLMGEMNPERIQMVQFHQSYSYEDFILGYRPNENGGFSLAEGPFYSFCKKAEQDDENDHFFIVDEINRGNLSKIFGELLMLVESDKRGSEHQLRLLYKNEQFSVPANVHLIGTMNTADRSLAFIDYALRRRFAFFDVAPGFETEQFAALQHERNQPLFDAIVNQVRQLNETIENDPSLGPGFRIGHSYFCSGDVRETEYEAVRDWLVTIVEYELVPLLSEYWFDEPDKVNTWCSRMRDAFKSH